MFEMKLTITAESREEIEVLLRQAADSVSEGNDEAVVREPGSFDAQASYVIRDDK